MSHSDSDPINEPYCPHGVPHFAECVLCEREDESPSAPMGVSQICNALTGEPPKQQWIKCSDRMPPRDVAVIVGAILNGEWIVALAHADGRGMGMWTHWMSLPAQPEGVEFFVRGSK